jgi:hypothetical protein
MSDQAVNQDPRDAPASSIRFEVLGQPPLKNEALSVFNTKHGQADRIRALLQAAQRACQEHGFTPIVTGRVALDVVTRLRSRTSGDRPTFSGAPAKDSRCGRRTATCRIVARNGFGGTSFTESVPRLAPAPPRS